MKRIRAKIASSLRLLRLTGPSPRLLIAEISHRLRRAFRQKRLRRDFAGMVAEVEDGARLDLPLIELPTLDELPPELAGIGKCVLDEASNVLDHRMRFLSPEWSDYGPEIDWLSDPATGYRWRTCLHFDIVVSDLNSPDDPKRVWELSRGHQLLMLARASRLDPDGPKRWVDEIEAQVLSWIDANPVGYTINWTNAMESGIRAANWLTALSLAGPDRFDPGFLREATVALQQHGRFIMNHLEGSPRMRSNHFVGDLLGLAALGSCLVGDPQAKVWMEAAEDWLPREVEAQVHADGGDFEASVPYHGLVLEMFTVSAWYLQRNGWVMPPRTRARLEAMVSFGVGIRHPDGRAPQFGDGDSGRVLPAGFERQPTLDPVLWSAAAVLGLPNPLPGTPDPEVALNFGLPAWDYLNAGVPSDVDLRSDFPNSGIYVLRSANSHAVADCGDVGQAGNGGHAHNDALSFEWSVGGEAIVVDPGTYAYTSDPISRNEMRSTTAHSTPMVDGEELNPIDPGRLFQLDETSPPKVTQFVEAPDEVTLVASHSSYGRLKEPVSVVRKLALVRENDVLSVDDVFRGSGRHQISMTLTLAPGCGTEVGPDGVIRISKGSEQIDVYVSGADVGVGMSWYSPVFGHRVRTNSLHVTATLQLPETIKIKLRPVR